MIFPKEFAPETAHFAYALHRGAAALTRTTDPDRQSDIVLDLHDRHARLASQMGDTISNFPQYEKIRARIGQALMSTLEGEGSAASDHVKAAATLHAEVKLPSLHELLNEPMSSRGARSLIEAMTFGRTDTAYDRAEREARHAADSELELALGGLRESLSIKRLPSMDEDALLLAAFSESAFGITIRQSAQRPRATEPAFESQDDLARATIPSNIAELFATAEPGETYKQAEAIYKLTAPLTDKTMRSHVMMNLSTFLREDIDIALENGSSIRMKAIIDAGIYVRNEAALKDFRAHAFEAAATVYKRSGDETGLRAMLDTQPNHLGNQAMFVEERSRVLELASEHRSRSLLAELNISAAGHQRPDNANVRNRYRAANITSDR